MAKAFVKYNIIALKKQHRIRMSGCFLLDVTVCSRSMRPKTRPSSIRTHSSEHIFSTHVVNLKYIFNTTVLLAVQI